MRVHSLANLAYDIILVSLRSRCNTFFRLVFTKMRPIRGRAQDWGKEECLQSIFILIITIEALFSHVDVNSHLLLAMFSRAVQ